VLAFLYNFFWSQWIFQWPLGFFVEKNPTPQQVGKSGGGQSSERQSVLPIRATTGP
jgi:hypothetical protein